MTEPTKCVWKELAKRLLAEKQKNKVDAELELQKRLNDPKQKAEIVRRLSAKKPGSTFGDAFRAVYGNTSPGAAGCGSAPRPIDYWNWKNPKNYEGKGEKKK